MRLIFMMIIVFSFSYAKNGFIVGVDYSPLVTDISFSSLADRDEFSLQYLDREHTDFSPLGFNIKFGYNFDMSNFVIRPSINQHIFIIDSEISHKFNESKDKWVLFFKQSITADVDFFYYFIKNSSFHLGIYVGAGFGFDINNILLAYQVYEMKRKTTTTIETTDTGFRERTHEDSSEKSKTHFNFDSKFTPSLPLNLGFGLNFENSSFEFGVRINLLPISSKFNIVSTKKMLDYVLKDNISNFKIGNHYYSLRLGYVYRF